ncbi:MULTISPECIES: flagellar biosynthesis protein FlgG [Bacillus cereus group]|uniref:flagellar biosynthesis protein FlgG n=1 Tax=Bacillus cereus group TaxID=86661 RepID=UPI000A36F467|nr:flagellar biosynthesis protein FlgG [Bacillus thuringiensis]MEB8736450.1 flagellar biosynthesis protein FlgG [Bacillus cereus]MEB8905278.1 flagellar biosynthesis protein FlgG [Bacillus cereus]MEB9986219.1 flagellar biosynthesis protein FlgG [Bacillus cereus]MEB9991437.1 flagellar biosynthesis protein FlgG [Bacillus cereus]MEC3111331.1 flagellar biosynthesis protein FlgG [Bacillus cereus]
MNEKVYEEFVSSIYELADLKLSEEMFQKKQDRFNQWLISLEEEKKQEVIEKIMPIIMKVSERIQDKQQVFKEIILENEGVIKANSHYDKF